MRLRGWTWWRLAAVAVGLPMVEAVLIDLIAPSPARALAPQASALGPFGIFHDLRWLLVYHSSWLLFIIEFVAVIALRGALIGFFVREAWPDGARRPSARAAIVRGILFTAGGAIVLMPWAIIMFAQAVIPVSWFFFAAIPPFLIVAMLTHHGSVSSWLRRPPLRVIGYVVLSFFVLSIGGAIVELVSRPAGVLVAGVVGLFNAYAWRATVAGVVHRRAARRTALIPALLVVALAVVVGGSAIGFAATAPIPTDRPPRADTLTTGDPVLVVKGFGGSYAGGATYSFGSEFLARRYSYTGLGTNALPLPYEPADTSLPMSVLVQRMAEQVDALHTATGRPVAIVAESEGALVAERYIERGDTPVDHLILLSPILKPGSVYYPPRGQEGWGVAAGWGLRGLASVMSAVSPLRFEADAPIVRDVVDSPTAFGDGCGGTVARVEFMPLADAVAARLDLGDAPGEKVVTAFHGGLLGDPAVRSAIRTILLHGTATTTSTMRALDTLVWASAGAWRVPALWPSLNPAWQISTCR
ncbi:MAG: hypothetical protein ACXVPP_10350 [Actinomycetota bacterium]